MRHLCVITALILALPVLPGGALAEQLLAPYKAEYKVKISVLRGKLVTEVRRTPDGYSAHSVLRAAGIARLFVRGNIEENAWFGTRDGSVIPQRYSSVDSISSDPKVMQFEFDWERHEVVGTINDEPRVVELAGLVHDRVSIQYELMLDLLNNTPESNYTLLNEDELRPIMVSNIGTKSIKVPFGRFDAVGIQHSTENSSRVSTLWFAPELGYLPIVIEQHRDGKLRVRAVLQDYGPIIETAAN